MTPFSHSTLEKLRQIDEQIAKNEAEKRAVEKQPHQDAHPTGQTSPPGAAFQNESIIIEEKPCSGVNKSNRSG